MKHTSTLSSALIGVIAAMAVCIAQQASSAAPGWQTLIKGNTGLDNFKRLGAANWVATGGAIQASYGDPAFLVSKESYGDFVIKAEFWVSDDANSGIFIRCSDPAKVGSDTCYEVNIFDKRPDPSYGTGAIVNVGKVSPMPKAGGKWNTYEITARGSHLTVVLNGQTTVDAQDSKHASGPFALQWGAGLVKFRSLQIRRL
jgi:hypothetical protein